MAEALARHITETLTIPTIGIGASPACDGQVLVTEDMIGAFDAYTPRFVKRYADANAVMREAIRQYAHDVRQRVSGSRIASGTASRCNWWARMMRLRDDVMTSRRHS